MKTTIEILITLSSFVLGAVILSFLSFTQKTVVGYPHMVLGYAIPALVGGLVGATISLLYRRITLLSAQHDIDLLHSSVWQAHTRAQVVYSTLAGSVLLCLFSAIQKAVAGYPMKLQGFTVPLLFGGISGTLIGLYLARNRQLLSQQKQAVRFWQQEKDRTYDILTSISDGLLVTNGDGRVELVNPAAEQLLELPAATLRGQTLPAIMTRATAQDHSRFFTPSNIGNSSQFTIMTQDGSSRVVRGRTAAVHNGQVCTGEVILLLHDTTAEQRIDRMKSEFISTATHNLKTPITAITGYSELLLLQDNLPLSERHEFLTYIHDKAWQLNKLVDNLLDISRVEAGREIRLEKGSVAAQEMIDHIQRYCEEQQSRCEFRFQLGDGDSRLYIDQAKIEQVIENLITNAIKFSPGGGQICISGKKLDANYEITVSDEGIGMTEEECCQIFDKFYRADASDKGTQGIGLGLTLVKQLIEAHGGDIRVASVPRQGTTISFTLPLRDDEFDAR